MGRVKAGAWAKADRALQVVPQLSKTQLPQPSEITEYQVRSYTGTMGDKVHVVTARHANKQAGEKISPRPGSTVHTRVLEICRAARTHRNPP